MKRLFVLTIKYIPIIQLIGMLINNSLYTYDINIEFDYIGDFLLGNSIVNISMLYVCSFTFGFCNIQRVADHADFNLWRRTCRMISGEVVLPNRI